MGNTITAIFGAQADPSLKSVPQQFAAEMQRVNTLIAEQRSKSFKAMRPGEQQVAMAQLSERYYPSFLKNFAKNGEQAGDSWFSNFSKKLQSHGTGGMSQLVHVFRASFDSLASGMSPWRVILQQGPQAMQALTSMSAATFAKILNIAKFTLGPLALVGIIGGSLYVYFQRVANMVKDMVGPMREVFSTEHIGKYLQKANTLLELQKDLTEESRRTQEAHDSVAEAMDRELALTKDRIGYEKELLEIQKANELARATSPAQREAIEKRYSKLILEKKKEERDAELQNMRDLAARLPAEIKKKQDDIGAIIADNSYFSEAKEAAMLKEKNAADETFADYRKTLIPGADDKRDFSLQKDKDTVAQLTKLKAEQSLSGFLSGGLVGFTAKDQQRLDNAQNRIADAHGAKTQLDSFTDAKGDRERQRNRVAELERQVAEDQKKLSELGSGKSGKIADTLKANLQRDTEDSSLEKARLARTDNPAGSSPAGSSRGGVNLNSQQRLGSYLATPPDAKHLMELVTQIANHTSSLSVRSNAAPTTKGPQFGTHPRG